MEKKRILSVGSCGADNVAIRSTLASISQIEVDSSDTPEEALEQLKVHSCDLVLINRVVDRDGSCGLELIRQMKSDPVLCEIPVMLVSNFDDYQQRAQQLGALPGFGKAQPESKIMDQIQAVLGLRSLSQESSSKRFN